MVWFWESTTFTPLNAGVRCSDRPDRSRERLPCEAHRSDHAVGSFPRPHYQALRPHKRHDVTKTAGENIQLVQFSSIVREGMFKILPAHRGLHGALLTNSHHIKSSILVRGFSARATYQPQGFKHTSAHGYKEELHVTRQLYVVQKPVAKH